MTQDLKAQVQQMRTCADALDSAASVFAQVQQLRSQAADLMAQADSLEKQAHDALGLLSCYQPASAVTSSSVRNSSSDQAVAGPSQVSVVPLWDGSKFVVAA